MKNIFVLVGVLFGTSVFASELPLAPYVSVQEALAKDDFKTALSLHKTLCSKELKNIQGEYKDCQKNFKSMEELRTSFKTLSEVYLKNGNKKEMQEFQKASCPMAEAKWIQKKGELANPYYGKSMLTCGEKI